MAGKVLFTGRFALKNYLMLGIMLAGGFAASTLPGSAAVVGVSNDNTFAKTVLASPTPVVVDFFADWCGPCRRMSPVFDRVAAQSGDGVKFVRVNIDTSRGTAARYGISSIPAIRVFKDGRLVGSADGLMPEQQLSATINQALNRTAAGSNGM
jgi:thioredoxin 1